MVGVCDVMFKFVDVQLIVYEIIGVGLCIVIICGLVFNVVVVVEIGMYEVERIGELNVVMVIFRVLDDLEKILLIVSYLIEEKFEFLCLLIVVKDKEKEFVRLLDFF